MPEETTATEAAETDVGAEEAEGEALDLDEGPVFNMDMGDEDAASEGEEKSDPPPAQKPDEDDEESDKPEKKDEGEEDKPSEDGEEKPTEDENADPDAGKIEIETEPGKVEKLTVEEVTERIQIERDQAAMAQEDSQLARGALQQVLHEPKEALFEAFRLGKFQGDFSKADEAMIGLSTEILNDRVYDPRVVQAAAQVVRANIELEKLPPGEQARILADQSSSIMKRQTDHYRSQLEATKGKDREAAEKAAEVKAYDQLIREIRPALTNAGLKSDPDMIRRVAQRMTENKNESLEKIVSGLKEDLTQGSESLIKGMSTDDLLKLRPDLADAINAANIDEVEKRKSSPTKKSSEDSKPKRQRKAPPRVMSDDEIAEEFGSF